MNPLAADLIYCLPLKMMMPTTTTTTMITIMAAVAVIVTSCLVQLGLGFRPRLGYESYVDC